MRSSQEACPRTRDTLLAVPQPWVVQTAGRPPCLWEGAQRLAGWDFKLEMATGKGRQGRQVSTTATLGSQNQGVKGWAGAHEGEARVKAWGPCCREG